MLAVILQLLEGLCHCFASIQASASTLPVRKVCLARCQSLIALSLTVREDVTTAERAGSLAANKGSKILLYRCTEPLVFAFSELRPCWGHLTTVVFMPRVRRLDLMICSVLSAPSSTPKSMKGQSQAQISTGHIRLYPRALEHGPAAHTQPRGAGASPLSLQKLWPVAGRLPAHT